MTLDMSFKKDFVEIDTMIILLQHFLFYTIDCEYHYE